ncbi:SseB family protein [Schaalia vaccimaxillae]|uniref:SseB family protein n=1 Tax=Schaalia vaccimaxillae TaxID=183916 RepID=UPI0003B68E46|nr:SseB family protein [Schaalia vaccimaxillae]
MTSQEHRPVPELSQEQKNRLAQRLAMMTHDRQDVGQALPRTSSALLIPADEDNGAARLEALVEALVFERVIVPIDVEPDPRETGIHAGESPEGHNPVDFVRVETPAGEALAVYSSAQTLGADRPGDRPMALDFRTIGLSALVETGGRIVMDPGGAAVVLPRPAVAALSQGDEWLPAWKDHELIEELRSLAGAGQEGPIADVRVMYAGDGLFRVELLVDISGDAVAMRARVEAALRAVGSSKRLIAAADRVELAPVRA